MSLQLMKSDERNDGQKSNVRSVLPARAAGDLEAMAAAMSMLAELGHEKMTVRQALFFFAVAYKRAMGQTATVPLIREAYPILGRSIEKSKEQFLEATKQYPDALGWITQVVDEDDRRMRHLDLSEDGLDVVGGVIEALRQVK